MKTRNKIDEQSPERLETLSQLLATYAHRWGENPSERMTRWVDEFEAIREERPEMFKQWCDRRGFPHSVTAYDCLA